MICVCIERFYMKCNDILRIKESRTGLCTKLHLTFFFKLCRKMATGTIHEEQPV